MKSKYIYIHIHSCNRHPFRRGAGVVGVSGGGIDAVSWCGWC